MYLKSKTSLKEESFLNRRQKKGKNEFFFQKKSIQMSYFVLGFEMKPN